MTENEIKKELQRNEDDRKVSEMELENSRDAFARKILEKGLGNDLNGYYYKPVKYRKPFSMRLNELWSKIRYVLFGE